MGAAETIADRYRVEAILGEGAAARVVRARDLQLGREVAVKLLKRGGPIADPARFLAEARALARLRHPHIVEVFDYGAPADGLPFLVLELATGGSLQDHCEPDGIPEEEVRTLGEELVGALAEAHRSGILHRDLKLENVLRAADGTAKLTDFGLAKYEDSGVRTKSGLVFGTPEYMAPEVMEGKAASPASDVYSFGCLLYHMVNGRPPHMGSLTEIYRARSSGHLESRRETGHLQLAIRRALEVAPEERASLDEVRALLRGESPARVAARRAAAMEAGPIGGSTSRSAGRRRLGFLAGLASAGAFAAALLLLQPGAPRPPLAADSQADASPAADPAERWRARVRGLDVPVTIRRLHTLAYGEREGRLAEEFQREMLQARRDIPVDTDLEALREALEALPHRLAFEEERTALAEFLLEEAVPYSKRLQLFEVLQELASLDAYARSWGVDEPYGASAVLRVLVPARAGGAFAPPPPREGPADAGTNLLFRWTQPADRDWPMLVPQVDEDRLSHTQNVGWGAIIASTGGRWSPEDHKRIRASVDLAPEVAALRNARLRIQVRNLDLPNSLRMIWNSTVVDLYPPAWKSTRARYDSLAEDPWSLEVDLPRGSLRQEGNTLELRHRVLPGLRPISSFDVIHVVLDLEPESG